MDQPPFSIGRTVATPGALDALTELGIPPTQLLDRHVHGDWGDISSEDRGANERALKDGSRIFSVYKLNEAVTVWVITEADRSSTTLLLPSEY